MKVSNQSFNEIVKEYEAKTGKKSGSDLHASFGAQRATGFQPSRPIRVPAQAVGNDGWVLGDRQPPASVSRLEPVLCGRLPSKCLKHLT
jgi:hypothetical protein